MTGALPLGNLTRVAESVKRRVAAARLAVAFVAAGTIAGATAWAQAGPPPVAHSSASDIFKKAKFDSSNIKNGSLLFQDFKNGQVVSSKAFYYFRHTDGKHELEVNGDLQSIKGELGTYKPQFEAIRNELPSYVKMDEADNRYWKSTQPLVKGDGSVFTATGVPSAQNPVSLLSVPNLVNVDALPGGAAIKITNSSSSDISHASCTAPAGGTVGAGTLQPGESVSCATGEHSEAFQIIAGSQVATLNFTKIDTQVTVQILVGM